MSKRAVIYARQSLDRTGEGLAVERQLTDCRDLVQRKGFTLAGEYVDNDVSASGRKPRPEYVRMLDDAAAGRFDVIVSWAADRLTRRPIEVERLIDVLEANKIGLSTVSGEVDLSTPYGRAIARIFGAIARQEVEQKGARQARANRQRAEGGDVGWTRRPFGYDRKGGKVITVAAEARELRKAAKVVLTGGTLASIVTDLTARGVTTSTGGAWSVTTLRRLLLNPRMSGDAHYLGQSLGRGAWPVILDSETQARLAATLRDPKRRTQTSTTGKYLLSGVARCGRCGDVMFASPYTKNGRRSLLYRCLRAHLGRGLQDVDEVVEAVIVSRLARPDAAALFDNDIDVDALRVEAKGLRQRLDDLASLLGEGLLSAAAVREQAGRLRPELDEVERAIDVGAGTSPAAQLAQAPDVAAVWRSMDLKAKRAVIGELVEVTILPSGKGVRFDPEQVRIEWRAEQ